MSEALISSFLQSSAHRAGLDFNFGYRTRDLHTTACDALDLLAMTPLLRDAKSDLGLDNILRMVDCLQSPCT